MSRVIEHFLVCCGDQLYVAVNHQFKAHTNIIAEFLQLGFQARGFVVVSGCARFLQVANNLLILLQRPDDQCDGFCLVGIGRNRLGFI